MKYKKNDKVKVRGDLVVGNMYGKHGINESMKLLFGKIVTISEVHTEYYHIEDNSWRWIDEMFEPVEEKFKLGMFVSIKKDAFEKKILKENHRHLLGYAGIVVKSEDIISHNAEFVKFGNMVYHIPTEALEIIKPITENKDQFSAENVLIALVEGKKLREKSWAEKEYVTKESFPYIWCDENNRCGLVNVELLINGNWEIVEEEKKTLSDKRKGSKGNIDYWYEEKDVKEALKRIRTRIRDTSDFDTIDYDRIILEEVGKELGGDE